MIFACDISAEMISWMEENLLKTYSNILPMKIDGTSLPIEDNSTDLVFMITLHHELDQPIKSLMECFRVLKEGGKICIVDWKKEEMTKGPNIDIRCEPEDIKGQLRSSGFKNISINNELNEFFLIIAEK